MNYRSAFKQLRYLAFGVKRTKAYTDRWSRLGIVRPTMKVLALRSVTALIITGVFIQDSIISNEDSLRSYYEGIQVANRTDSARVVERLQDHLSLGSLSTPLWRVSIKPLEPIAGMALVSIQSKALKTTPQKLELRGLNGLASFDEYKKPPSSRLLASTKLAPRSWKTTAISRTELASGPLLISHRMPSHMAAWKILLFSGVGSESFSGSDLYSDVYLEQKSDFTQVLATNGRAIGQEVRPNTIVEIQLERGLTANLSAFVAMRYLQGSSSNEYVYQTEQQVTTIQTTRLPIQRSSSEGYSVETIEEEITTSTYAYDTLNVSFSARRVAVPLGLRYAFLSGSRLRPSLGIGSDIVLMDQIDYTYQSSHYQHSSGKSDLQQSGLLGLNAFALIGLDYNFGSGWNVGVQFSYRNRILDHAPEGMLHKGALSGALGIGYHF